MWNIFTLSLILSLLRTVLVRLLNRIASQLTSTCHLAEFVGKCAFTRLEGEMKESLNSHPCLSEFRIVTNFKDFAIEKETALS